MKPTRFLMMFIIVAALAFGTRLAEIVTDVPAMIPRAIAEDEDTADPTPVVIDDTKDTPDKASESQPSFSPPLWRDATDGNLQDTALQMEMLEELNAKRKALNEREQALVTREAVLEASRKEISQKYDELIVLKEEIEILLGKQSDEEKARIESLVKVYESMKAKDAARIFDTLDIDVLVSVMSKMSERRLSPILAAMNPERARTVTIILAEQKTLPDISGVR